MIDWDKQFPVAYVTRKDLVQAGIPAKLVENLNDEAMTQFAKALGHIYGDHEYWQNFAESVAGILIITLRIESTEREPS